MTLPPLPCKISGVLYVVNVVCKPPSYYHSIRIVWLVLHKLGIISQRYIEVMIPLTAAIAGGRF
ncbi:hypothetical protein BDN67DRAFT_965288 [Paxillus ammoniavirescens]|nr:hypothetical protein BDN67DRAFT_965288 [Paxillus ammoniavirescens]